MRNVEIVKGEEMPGVLNEMDVNHMQAALHGLRVVDLSRLLPGPFLQRYFGGLWGVGDGNRSASFPG